MTNKCGRALGRVASGFEKVVLPVSKVLNGVGVAMIMLIAVFIVADIILRVVFNSPTTGGYEIVQFAMVIMIFLAFPYTQHMKGNVTVELLIEHFSLRAQAIISVFMDIINLLFWGAIAYAGFAQAKAQYAKKVVSATLRIPIYPIVIVLAVGAAFFALVVVIDILRDLQRALLPRTILSESETVESTTGGSNH